MGKDSHYNPVLFSRLAALAKAADHAALQHFLAQLSNAQYRQAGYMLGEMIGPVLGAQQFWPLTMALVELDAKAFLVTMLKSVVEGMRQGTLSVMDLGFTQACQYLQRSPIDARKTLQTLLPALTDVHQIRHLFHLLGYAEMSAWIPHLLQALHPATAFVLLQALHYMEHDRAYILNVARHLVKRADPLSFNLASLIRTIYALDELKGTFSLHLEPFQLSRIEQQYDAFRQIVAMQ